MLMNAFCSLNDVSLDVYETVEVLSQKHSH